MYNRCLINVISFLIFEISLWGILRHVGVNRLCVPRGRVENSVFAETLPDHRSHVWFPPWIKHTSLCHWLLSSFNCPRFCFLSSFSALCLHLFFFAPARIQLPDCFNKHFYCPFYPLWEEKLCPPVVKTHFYLPWSWVSFSSFPCQVGLPPWGGCISPRERLSSSAACAACCCGLSRLGRTCSCCCCRHSSCCCCCRFCPGLGMLSSSSRLCHSLQIA